MIYSINSCLWLLMKQHASCCSYHIFCGGGYSIESSILDKRKLGVNTTLLSHLDIVMICRLYVTSHDPLVEASPERYRLVAVQYR